MDMSLLSALPGSLLSSAAYQQRLPNADWTYQDLWRRSLDFDAEQRWGATLEPLASEPDGISTTSGRDV